MKYKNIVIGKWGPLRSEYAKYLGSKQLLDDQRDYLKAGSAAFLSHKKRNKDTFFSFQPKSGNFILYRQISE